MVSYFAYIGGLQTTLFHTMSGFQAQGKYKTVDNRIDTRIHYYGSVQASLSGHNSPHFGTVPTPYGPETGA